MHGTFGNRGYTWNTAVPLLRRHGHRVFRLDYGQHGNPLIFGLGDIKHSARQLADFVTRSCVAPAPSRSTSSASRRAA